LSQPSQAPLGAPVTSEPARPLETVRLPSRASRLRAPAEAPLLHARRLSDVLAEGPDALARVANTLYHATHGDTLGEAVWTYMFYGPFENAAAFQDWLNEKASTHDPLFYVVFDGAIPVGVVAYLAIRPEHRAVELGHIWLIPAAQGRGLLDALVHWMQAEAFAKGYRRVEWKCDALNVASQRAAVRLGFKPEGVFRQHLIVKGRNRDTAWFSLLDSEWAVR
jgi:RimJ/RimL family protein N-acetyltransferase